MYALFKPKARTGQEIFTRRIGEIYFRKILPVPQPLDHKTGDEIMKWKSHSTPTCRFLQACSIVSKAKAPSAGKYTRPRGSQESCLIPGPCAYLAALRPRLVQASCFSQHHGRWGRAPRSLGRHPAPQAMHGEGPEPRVPGSPGPLCGVPGKDEAGRVFVVMTVVNSHCSQK